VLTQLPLDIGKAADGWNTESCVKSKSQVSLANSNQLVTGVGALKALPVPRTRKGFQTQVFQRYKRRQAELDQVICEMFVQGLSMVRVGTVVEGLTGTQPSPSTVSRVFHTLEDEFQVWKSRTLAVHYVYVFADGTYFSVIYADEGHKMPILAVVGINEAGEREVLGFTVGERENQQAWADLLDDLKQRGLAQVDLWITDGSPPCSMPCRSSSPTLNASAVSSTSWTMCWVTSRTHSTSRPDRNCAPSSTRSRARKPIRSSRPFVPSTRRSIPPPSNAFPKTHWKTIRNNNVIERLFGEVKKHSHKMAAAFRNEERSLLMFYAVTRSLRFQNLRMPTQEPDSAILHIT
jgi:putative transposase